MWLVVNPLLDAALVKFDEHSWGRATLSQPECLYRHEWFRMRQLLSIPDAQSKGILGVRRDITEADRVT